MRGPAVHIADYYRKKELLDETTIQKMEYTLEAVYNELSKLVIFMLLFSLVGKFTVFLLCYIAFVSLRIFAGGIHCKTYWGCFSFSLISFLFFIYLPVISDVSIHILRAITFFSCILPALFSPVLPSFRGIKNSRTKLILKITAVLVTLIWTSLSYTVDPVYSVSILIALSTANLQLVIPVIRDIFTERRKKYENA